MSTSLIYHAFGLQCYDYVRQFFVAGNVILSFLPFKQVKDVNPSSPQARSF